MRIIKTSQNHCRNDESGYTIRYVVELLLNSKPWIMPSLSSVPGWLSAKKLDCIQVKDEETNVVQLEFPFLNNESGCIKRWSIKRWRSLHRKLLEWCCWMDAPWWWVVFRFNVRTDDVFLFSVIHMAWSTANSIAMRESTKNTHFFGFFWRIFVISGELVNDRLVSRPNRERQPSHVCRLQRKRKRDQEANQQRYDHR
jgi:hypothetical protein